MDNISGDNWDIFFRVPTVKITGPDREDYLQLRNDDDDDVMFYRILFLDAFIYFFIFEKTVELIFEPDPGFECPASPSQIAGLPTNRHLSFQIMLFKNVAPFGLSSYCNLNAFKHVALFALSSYCLFKRIFIALSDAFKHVAPFGISSYCNLNAFEHVAPFYLSSYCYLNAFFWLFQTHLNTLRHLASQVIAI